MWTASTPVPVAAAWSTAQPETVNGSLTSPAAGLSRASSGPGTLRTRGGALQRPGAALWGGPTRGEGAEGGVAVGRGLSREGGAGRVAGGVRRVDVNVHEIDARPRGRRLVDG